MSMLQLDFRLPEFGNLVKDLGLEEGGRAQQHLVKKCCTAHHQVCAQAHIQQR